MSLTVEQIASDLNAPFEGNGSLEIIGIAGIREALEGDLSFVANARYATAAENTRATAVLVPKDWEKPCSAAIIRVESPDAAFAQVSTRFSPEVIEQKTGIHETAVISDEATVGEDVYIGPHCVLEPGCVVGDRTVIYAGGYIGFNAKVGDDCLFYSKVSVREHVEIGHRVILQDGVVIGSDGFGYTVDEQGVRSKIRQAGTVVVGNDVEIGANTTIDRARFGKTRIGEGVKIDNLVQIAHNVVIGDHAVIVAQAGIAGSTAVGRQAILAGQAGIAGHLVIGEGAIVGAQGGVTKDVAAGTFVSGYPAMPHADASRLHANLKKLPDLRKTVRELEDRIKAMENAS